MTNCEPVARRKLLTCQIYGSLKFVLLSRFGDGFTVAELEQLLLKVLDAVFSVNEAASFQNVFTKKRGFHWKTLFRFQSFQSQIKHFHRLRSFKTGLVDTLKEFQFIIFPKSKIRKFIFFSIFVSVFFSEFDWKWSSQIPIFGHRTSLGYLASSDSHFTEFPFYRECLAKK